MPEKKVKKTENKQSTFEKKMWEAKESMMETAGKVGQEGKKVAGKITNWWEKSSTEEKICMILWIVLLIIWVFGFESVRALIIPLIFIILWLLLIMGFFNTWNK